MHGCNSLSLAVDSRDVLLHVDCVFSRSLLDGLVVLVCTLVVLNVRDLGSGSGIESSCGLMVWGSLITVIWPKKCSRVPEVGADGLGMGLQDSLGCWKGLGKGVWVGYRCWLCWYRFLNRSRKGCMVGCRNWLCWCLLYAGLWFRGWTVTWSCEGCCFYV